MNTSETKYVTALTITGYDGTIYAPILFSSHDNAIAYVKKHYPAPIDKFHDLSDITQPESYYNPNLSYIDYHKEDGTYQLLEINNGVPIELSPNSRDLEDSKIPIATQIQQIPLEDTLPF